MSFLRLSVKSFSPEALGAKLSRWRFWAWAAMAALIGFLLWEAGERQLAQLHYADIVAASKSIPWTRLLESVLAMALSFVALTFYDLTAMRFAGGQVPYRVVAETSFIAYALSNTVGLGVLTGGAVRMRLYGAAGLDAGVVSRAIAFNAAGFGGGILVVGAGALVWGADQVAEMAGWSADALKAMGLAVLLGAGALLGASARGGEWRLRGWTFRLPDASLVAQQLLISAVDVLAAAACLWVLLPDGTIAFAPFLGLYSIALVLGVISHVPGGLGVFESVMVLGLGPHMPTDLLVGALLMYRLVYHLLPLVLAIGLLVTSEWQRGMSKPVMRAASSLSPWLLSVYTFVIGVVLLISGATPATRDASALLVQWVPLPLVEAAHFLGSILGLVLLFVARGMLLRLDAAWWAGLVVALISLVLCLPKGIAVSEAVLLTVLTLSLVLSRRQFDRQAALMAMGFTGPWLAAVSAVVAAVGVLLFFVYRDVDQLNEVWWQFAIEGDAPRSLRAMVAVAVLTLMAALARLLHRPPPALQRPTAAELAEAERIVEAQGMAGAGLALMGDKYLLFSASRQAFIMYGRKGRSWIALYDPVGPVSEWPELVWRFVEMANEGGGRAAFYQVRPAALTAYLDAGLRVFKLGECALVDLASFNLEGKRRANLRHGVTRGERDGLVFEYLPVVQDEAVLDELKAVSDEWLAQHQVAEKSFSLGAFDRQYVRGQPVTLVRMEGKVVAFATLLTTGDKAEIAIDLMRQGQDATKTTMDFLFARTMLTMKEQGFARFNLGMVPLSGMAQHRMAPRWHRAGRLLFNHGENFYNFRGLRSFKEKFDPVWEPRYLASRGGLAPIIVLSETAALIAGGWRKVIGK